MCNLIDSNLIASTLDTFICVSWIKRFTIDREHGKAKNEKKLIRSYQILCLCVQNKFSFQWEDLLFFLSLSYFSAVNRNEGANYCTQSRFVNTLSYTQRKKKKERASVINVKSVNIISLPHHFAVFLFNAEYVYLNHVTFGKWKKRNRNVTIFFSICLHIPSIFNISV